MPTHAALVTPYRQEAPGDEPQPVIAACGAGAEGGDTGGDPSGVSRGERQEQVPGEVRQSGGSRAVCHRRPGDVLRSARRGGGSPPPPPPTRAPSPQGGKARSAGQPG